MKILYKNELENASLSATNENTSYPVANLTDRFLEKIFKSSSTSSVVTITFPVNTNISAIALGLIGATNGTYTLKNSAGTSVLNGSLSMAYTTDITYFTETACRSIELTFNGASEFSMGGVSAGVPINISYWNINPRFDYYTRDEINIVTRGQSLGYQSAPLLRYRTTVAEISTALRTQLWAMTDYVGNFKPFYVDIYEDAHDEIRPIYCLFNGDGQYVRDSFAKDYSTSLIFEEVK
jgi:hypothetical protein